VGSDTRVLQGHRCARTVLPMWFLWLDQEGLSPLVIPLAHMLSLDSPFKNM